MYFLQSFTLLLAVKHKNCFVGCGNGQILFGSVNTKQFEEKCCVVLYIPDIVDFYCALIKLFSLMASGPYPSNNVKFMKSYFWQALNRDNIILVIEKNGNRETIEFNYESFNSLLFCLSKVLFVCLGLRSQEKLLFNHIASLPTETILSLKDPLKCSNFCKDFKEIEIEPYDLSILIVHYSDILIVYKKLLSVWDNSFNETNIEKILSTNS
jgi:hypothetical protein